MDAVADGACTDYELPEAWILLLIAYFVPLGNADRLGSSDFFAEKVGAFFHGALVESVSVA